MRIKSALTKSALLLLLGLPTPCRGQWLTQQIPLVPGWNAVYLEVQPEPRSCDEVFRGRPVQSVWKWDRRFSTIQFTVDPATLLPENPDWLMWLPASDPRAFLNRLSGLQGCQAYLIKVAANAAPFTLPVKGRVIIPRRDWYPHGLNLVGLPVNPKHPPTFTEFFSFTPEVDTSLGYGNQLYKLDSTGRGVQIVQPARDRPQPGVAYWVGCGRRPAYTAAINVTPQGGEVDFGTVLSANELSIRNPLSSRPGTVWLHQRASESAPFTGGYPEVAGPVPLSVLMKDASNAWAWVEFPTNGLTRTLAPQEEWVVRLGVRRQDFAPYTPQGTNAFNYASVLEITDGTESLLIRVPVTAQSVRVARAVSESAGGFDPQEGLWVGQATVEQVNAPAYTDDLLPTPAPAAFRLLVHVDGYGHARLLQQVLLAWDSTLTQIPHTNGTYALYANADALPHNATDVKRLSSAAFPLMAPLPMSGSFSNTLGGSVVVGFDDPVNPFLHRYHPRHDNKDWSFRPYTNAVETRTIHRDITLEFNPATNAPANPLWGVDMVGGTYHETLSGLRAPTLRAPTLRVQGEFTLQRISRIDTLLGITP